MTHRIFVGVDPGKSGSALALIEIERRTPDHYGLFEVDAISLAAPEKYISEWFHKFRDTCVICGIEKVGSFSGQGVKSTFTFGTSFGQCLQAAACLQVEPLLVTPREWQSHFGLYGVADGQSKKDKKDLHRDKAYELFDLNGWDLTRRTEDAFLIAAYMHDYYLTGEGDE